MDQQKEEALQPLTDEELSSEEMEHVGGGIYPGATTS